VRCKTANSPRERTKRVRIRFVIVQKYIIIIIIIIIVHVGGIETNSHIIYFRSYQTLYNVRPDSSRYFNYRAVFPTFGTFRNACRCPKQTCRYVMVYVWRTFPFFRLSGHRHSCLPLPVQSLVFACNRNGMTFVRQIICATCDRKCRSTSPH